MPDFIVGQRWISETEPELGLGILESVSRHQIHLVFSASKETRIYATGNAPIKRVEFLVGDTISSKDGQTIMIDEVINDSGLITYSGGGNVVKEADLADTISFSKPEDRLIRGQIDGSSFFSLRYETLVKQSRARKSNVVGFIGGRIDLIPHQLYIASEVSNRYLPRVLLADEVGLGKTIEACLVLHRLNLVGRASRILIIVPESLEHQWFVELLRRFNMWFTVFENKHSGLFSRVEESINPFLEDQHIICSISSLVENSEWAVQASEANWDMLVVDEAHHLEWTPQTKSPEYAMVESLAKKSSGLLLLTATPEQLGAEGHFARLRLLDPDRYPDLEQFQNEQADYSKVAAVANKLITAKKLSKADVEFLRNIFCEYSDNDFSERLKAASKGNGSVRQTLLNDLVDRHGTGRVIFRNSRDALKGFPKRIALPTPLDPRPTLSKEALQARLLNEFDLETDPGEHDKVFDYRQGPRIKWLAGLLRELKEEKILLICRTLEKVMAISDALNEEINVKSAVFHEGLTLIQRDRNAAWFSESDGARILICSEIGSEGRNFQFAHHLVLFDLPLNPELLEQRIGRLDRIGQTDTIKIHLPYLEGSCTKLLMQWHHEGIDGVEHSLKGGNAYLNKFGMTVRKLGKIIHEGTPKLLAEADRLIIQSNKFRVALEAKLSAGQDRLIALNSFREEVSDNIIDCIRENDADQSLDEFMNKIFDHFGVTVEDIDKRTFNLMPGQLFTDAFPGLPETGTTVTCDRVHALSREDIGFLTWDHPMVRGSMDLILSSERGNSSFVIWTLKEREGPPVLIEAIYILESVAPSSLHVDRFLPPTPIRVVVDMNGINLSDTYSHELINNKTRDEEAFRLQKDPEMLHSLIPEMLKSARRFARDIKSELLENAMHEAHAHLDGEARRLRELKEINANVREEEINIAENVIQEITRHIAKAHLRLDSVRLVIRDTD